MSSFTGQQRLLIVAQIELLRPHENSKSAHMKYKKKTLANFWYLTTNTTIYFRLASCFHEPVSDGTTCSPVPRAPRYPLLPASDITVKVY